MRSSCELSSTHPTPCRPCQRPCPTQKKVAASAKWLRKAAEQNLAEAQSDLGICYLFGKGVKQDEIEAVKWFRKAADQGLAGAQLNLGLSYENGSGVKQDKVEAAKWYHKAAEQGFEPAKEALKNLEN